MFHNDHEDKEDEHLRSNRKPKKGNNRNIVSRFRKELLGRKIPGIKSKATYASEIGTSTTIKTEASIDISVPFTLPYAYEQRRRCKTVPPELSVLQELDFTDFGEHNSAQRDNITTASSYFDDPYKHTENINETEFNEEWYEDTYFSSTGRYVYDDFNIDQESMLTRRLITLCNPNESENNYHKTAQIFYEMGLLYREKSPDKFSLIRAAALFNAARIRSDTIKEKCTQRLFELSHHIQSLAGAKNKENLVVKANKLAEKIAIMRRTVQQDLKTLKQIPDHLERNELYDCEENKILKVRDIQDYITDEYVNIMSDLSAFCEHIIGEPPCHFAIIGMGSLARKEITPYSDFEHIIVLQEGCQKDENYFLPNGILNYFRWYSAIFHIVIINLKETIIPSVAIPNLNDEASKWGNWFFDAFTKRGISLDGMMPHACKFPLGRPMQTPDKPFTTELIKPVSEMLDYLNSDTSIKEGYHLGDILTKTCLVYGNEDIYNDFAQGVEQTLRSAYKKGWFDDLEIQLKEDLTNFAIDKKALTLLKSNENFNLKRLVYRSTTLFISAWGRLEGIYVSSSFDIISALCEKKIISSNQMHKLMYAVALACEIRLRVYLEKDRQDDIFESEFRQESSCHSFLNVVGKTSLLNYFQIAYALQLAICKRINVKPTHLIPDPNLLNVSVCSALGLQGLTDNLLHLSITSTAPNIDIYDFDECLSYLEEGIRLDFENIDVNIQVPKCLPKSKVSPKEIAYRYSYCAKYLFNTQNFFQAFEYVHQALTIMKIISNNSVFYASCCELAGCCLLRMEKHNKAWFYFEEVLKIYENLHQSDGIKADVRIVLTYLNLGICLFFCDHVIKAQHFLYKALSIYVEQNLSKGIAETRFYIASCYSKMKKYALSNLHLKKSLNYFKEVSYYYNCGKEYSEALLLLTLNYSMKTIQSDDIMLDFHFTIQHHFQHALNCNNCSIVTLFKLGKCLLELGLYDFAYNVFMRCSDVFEIAYLQTLNKQMCVLYSSIGECLMGQNKYNESLVYLLDALVMFRRISANIDKDFDVAMAFKHVGSCLLEMKQFKDALKNFQNSFSILKDLAVKDSDEAFAALHNDIGVCLMEMYANEEALQHLQTSLLSSSSLTQNNTVVNSNLDVALNNVGKCLMRLNRHEEAIEVFEKALKMQAKLNDFNPAFTSNDITVTLNNIGLCLMEMNKFQDSLIYFKRAESVCLRFLESGFGFASVTRKQMTDTLNNLGINYMSIKDYKNAIEKFQAALAYYAGISKQLAENSDACLVRNNLGLCYMSIKLYQEALVQFKRSLEVFESVDCFTCTEIMIAAICNNIGLCLMEKYSKDSLYFFIKSLRFYQNTESSSNQDVAAVLHNIALVYMSMGELEEALSILQNARDLFQSSCRYFETDPNIAEVFHSIGICMTRMGKFPEALSCFERSLKIRQNLSSDETDDKDVLRTLYNGGNCLSALNLNKNSWFEKKFSEVALKFIKECL